MEPLRSADWRWKEGGGYYTSRVEDLERSPLLPDFRRLRDRQLAAMFYTALGEAKILAPEVLELGCGGSRWLPWLARQGYPVVGIDLEPSAAALAIANLKGARTHGNVICGDAFDPDGHPELLGRFDLVYSMGLLEHFGEIAGLLRRVRRYLAPGGRIVTTVPNFQGVNWALQRLGDRGILETHVLYSAAALARAHAAAGFTTRARGYLGFYDGFVSEGRADAQGPRASVYRAACRYSNLAGAALTRVCGTRLPDLWCLAPFVYYVGVAE